MRESIERVLVIDRNPHRELDHVVTLLSSNLGMFRAHLKSSRRMTSKLNSHLEPLNLADVRLVKNRHLHITDALRIDQLDPNPKNIHALAFLKNFFTEETPDRPTWQVIEQSFQNQNKTIASANLLEALGLHQQSAKCETCKNSPAAYYSPLNHFYCETCALQEAIRDYSLII